MENCTNYYQESSQADGSPPHRFYEIIYISEYTNSTKADFQKQHPTRRDLEKSMTRQQERCCSMRNMPAPMTSQRIDTTTRGQQQQTHFCFLASGSAVSASAAGGVASSAAGAGSVSAMVALLDLFPSPWVCSKISFLCDNVCVCVGVCACIDMPVSISDIGISCHAENAR